MHFARQREIAFYPKQATVKPSAVTLRNQRNRADSEYGRSRTGSGLVNAPSMENVKRVQPSNVFTCAVGNNRHSRHPAVMPMRLAEFFIKLFTKPTDMVFDPFCGSGTTLKVAYRHGRDSLGIDNKPEYIQQIREWTNNQR